MSGLDLACRFCRHKYSEHRLDVGCPHCSCLATRGEASPRTDAELDAKILPPTITRGSRYSPLTAPLASGPDFVFRTKAFADASSGRSS